MTTPVYEAYLRAQLEIIHDEIVKLWKISNDTSYAPSPLRKQINQVIAMLPDNRRLPGMPPKAQFREVKKQIDNDFEELLG